MLYSARLAPRFSHYADRLMPYLRGEHLLRAFPQGHGTITPLLWNFTPFDGDIPFDDEIQRLIAMEREIGTIPSWALDIAVQIDALPHCGQTNFPESLLAVCRGIGAERADAGYLFCFEARSATKAHVRRLASALDDWAREEPADAVTAPHPDVAAFVVSAYEALGSASPLKRLLVEYVSAYLTESVEVFPTCDPGVVTLRTTPSDATERLRTLRTRILEEAAQFGFNAERFFGEFDSPWLCHQRLFEQVNITLSRIGRETVEYDWNTAKQDAEPASTRMRRLYTRSIEALGEWLDGTASSAVADTDWVRRNTSGVLGERTPVKVWLASAFRKKLILFRDDDLTDTLAV